MNVQEMKDIVACCNYENWKIVVIEGSGTDRRPYLQIQAKDQCSITGKPYKWTGRKWMLSAFMTASEVVQTAFLAVMTAMEHEVREKFKYKSHPIFRPHFNVDALVELCQQDRVARLEEHAANG